MDTQVPKLEFLDQYILLVLKENGFEDLTPENQEQFLPQFTAEAQRRIGLALLPKLDEDSGEKMLDMAANEKTTPEEWQEFWTNSVSDFTEVVKQALLGYAKDLKKVLAGI